MLLTNIKTDALRKTSGFGSSFFATPDAISENMGLRDATRLLQRRLNLIIGITVACAVIALVIALLITPQFRAEAIVLLDSRQTDVTDMSAVMGGLTADSTVLRSEMDIIQSRTVIDRVIDKLDLLNDVEFNPKHSFLHSLNPSQWFKPALTELEQKERERAQAAKLISDRLKVTNDGRSYSIHILFDSKDSHKAALITNTFADEYLVDQLESKYDATARANKWLNERLTTLKQQVETSEKAVEDFREKANLIEVEDGTTVAARQLEDINSQLSVARGETAKAEASLRSAQSMMNSKDGINGAADVLASPLIQNLREKEAEVRRNETELASKYGEMHPKMIDAHAQYKDLQNKIAEEVHKIIQGMANEVEIARAKEVSLEKQLDEQEKRANVEMKDSVGLRQLQREAQANRTLYESFLNRFKETTEQQDLQVADSRIIARADIPVEPSYPFKSLFMLVGAILGGIFGIILAYLLEYFDGGFRNAAQIEELSGIPVIGVIPTLTGITELSPENYVADKPLSAYSESLRTVRTAIHFSNVDSPPKTVMVTSSIPGEGKTTFCLSLGRSLAKAGKKILLIDADMRRPHVAQIIGIAETNGGLAALLTGEKQFAEVMQPDPLVPGLDIIPSASKTPNAQDLLVSHRMKTIIDEVSPLYDLVIIDTPPILAVTDAAMAARVVDTTLFLVQWSKVPRETSLRAIKQLSLYDCKIAGIVMTQVDFQKHAQYSNDGHHYGYTEYYNN